MCRTFIIPLFVVAMVLTGCAAGSGMAGGKEQAAISQTLAQARSDLRCAELTPKVLSKEMSMTPVPEARLKIAVTGCGKDAVYNVACQEFGEGYKDCFISLPGEP